MSIDELLQLDATENNLIEIDNYITSKTLTVFDYQTVFIHLLKLKIELEKYNEVFNDSIVFFNKYQHQATKNNLLIIFEFIIKAGFKIKKYDIVYEYINKQKSLLPIEEKYIADLNLIEFKKLTNQNYIYEMEVLSKDLLPEDIKLNILNELLSIYMKTHQEIKVDSLINELKKIDYKQTYIPKYFESLYQTNQLDKLVELANQYKAHHLYQIDSYLALLRNAIDSNDQHRVTILDAEYHEVLENSDYYYKNLIYPLLINFYQKINSQYNVKHYTELYKKITKLEKKEKQKLDDKKVVLDDDIKEVKSEEIIKKQTKKLKFDDLETLMDLINYSHQINELKNFRDVLRSFFIKVEESLKVKDYIVFKNDTETIYNYKLERLYDKEILKTTYIDTVIGDILKDGEDRFGEINTLSNNKNVLTMKPYDENIKYYYGFSLLDKGVFLVHFEEEITDPGMYYDLLKGIASIIYTLLADEEKNNNLRSDLKFLNKIISSELNAIRIMTPSLSTYNVASQRLLGVDSHIPYETYLRNLGLHEVKSYQMLIQRLFTKPNLNDAITYVYQDKQIRERLVSIEDQGQIKIVSSFEDLSNYYEERRKLIMEATIDFETSLPNMNALNEKLPGMIQNKGSFILISFNESILPIYGYDVAMKYFKEFGQLTKKHFTSGEVYRFSTYQLLLYIPVNDIRSVTKEVKDYLKFVDAYESTVINYEKFLPKLAIIRYPVVTEEKNPTKLFRYLEVSLDYLKRSLTEESYIFFEHKIYEDEVFEQQVINYLNEALNKNQLSVIFNQIIDIERNIVWQYESDILLENINIDSKYLISIAKKRNRLFELDKAHIKMVFEFLNTLEKQSEKLVKITIPVQKETFTDINFNPYVFGLFQKYQIPFEFIRFKIRGENLKSTHHINQIDELTKVGVGMDTTNIEMALSYPFNALHVDFKKSDTKWNDYIKLLSLMLANHQMALVIRDVKTKEQKEMLSQLGIKYIEGQIYKKITADQLFYKIVGN